MTASSRGNAAKPIQIDLEFEDAMKALLSVDPADLQDEDESPSQQDRKKSAPDS
jgi:hypothetical protein